VTEYLTLNIEAMDRTHDDFMELLDGAKRMQGAAFLEAFAALITHTDEHFAMEEALMRTYSFYAMQEHLEEHETLLAEMRYFFDKAKKIPAFGRSYIDDYAFEKFRRHIINIDSQLAMFLHSRDAASEVHHA
jgi:hemerythrin